MWHKIAPRLARDFTVVAADLRGYGDSSKPPLHRRSRAVLEARDGPRPGRGDAAARLRAVLPGRPRSRRALRVPAGARPPRARAEAGGARHHPDRRGVPARRHAVRPAHLALVLPGPAGRLPGAGHQPGAGRVLRTPADDVLRRRRRGRSTGAATRTRTRSAPSARTTAPAPPSTTRTTRRTAASGRSPARCWCSGATRAAAQPALGLPRRSGASGPTTSAAAASIAATSWPKRRPTRPTPSCTPSSPADRDGTRGRPAYNPRVQLRIFTEPQQGAAYAELLAMARTAEDCGFDAFFRSDHFGHGPPRRAPGPTDAWADAGRARARDPADPPGDARQRGDVPAARAAGDRRRAGGRDERRPGRARARRWLVRGGSTGPTGSRSRRSASASSGSTSSWRSSPGCGRRPPASGSRSRAATTSSTDSPSAPEAGAAARTRRSSSVVAAHGGRRGWLPDSPTSSTWGSNHRT